MLLYNSTEVDDANKFDKNSIAMSRLLFVFQWKCTQCNVFSDINRENGNKMDDLFLKMSNIIFIILVYTTKVLYA